MQTHFELAGPIRLKHVTLFGCRVAGETRVTCRATPPTCDHSVTNSVTSPLCQVTPALAPALRQLPRPLGAGSMLPHVASVPHDPARCVDAPQYLRRRCRRTSCHICVWPCIRPCTRACVSAPWRGSFLVVFRYCSSCGSIA